VICDDATPLETREQLRARGVELEIVPVLTLSATGSPAAGPVAEPTRVERDLQLTG
jgi:hypothetical protein